MTANPARTITIAWIVLTAVTVGTWWLAPGHSGTAPTPNVAITVAVLALAFLKGRLIVRYFMDIRSAPAWLKISTDAWLAVVCVAVLAIYLV